MKILVTGSKGFVGKNLMATLNYLDYEVVTFNRDNSLQDLKDMVLDVDFVVHLAGSNRPINTVDFYSVNADLTKELVNAIENTGRTIPILLSSSIQALNDSDYGKSKLSGENIVIDYAKRSGAQAYIYRYPNLFGKWSQPNYNTVIATWCHNISRDLPIQINDSNVEIELAYIDDVVEEIINAIEGKGNHVDNYFFEVSNTSKVSLGRIIKLLKFFKASRQSLFLPNMSKGFETQLYSTYLSFLPNDQFSYPLTMHQDHRGSFTEFLKTDDRGQVSINISKPGITKGEHWHHSKNEKFLVVKGEGIIKLRDIYSDEVVEYSISSDKLEVVDIPTGYTHSIINTSSEDMVTVMWVNEPFDPTRPDTYFETVEK